MGLLIHTSFETPEGFPVTSVYCRIVEVTFRPHTAGQFTVSYRMEFYVDRSARLNGRLPIRVPTLGDGQTYVGAFGDFNYLYGLLKTNLESAGLTVENVDPDPQSPEPEPTPTEPVPEPTPTEPTPTEPVPEPTPTEPVPEPTPTEPTPTEPVPEPTPTEPVPEPTPTEPVPEPTPTEPVPEPTPTEPVPEPTPTEPVPEPTSDQPL